MIEYECGCKFYVVNAPGTLGSDWILETQTVCDKHKQMADKQYYEPLGDVLRNMLSGNR